MKILVASNHLARTGGTENYTFALAIQLKDLGHEWSILLLKKGKYQKKWKS